MLYDQEKVDEVLASAYGIKKKTTEEKIKKVFGDDIEEVENTPNVVEPEKKETEEDPEKVEVKKEDQPDLTAYMTKEEVEQVLAEKIKPYEEAEANRHLDGLKAEEKKLKLEFSQAQEDGDDEKAEEILEKLTNTKVKISGIEQAGKKDDGKPKPLMERISDAERGYATMMIHNLRSEMFVGEEGKARELKIAKIHYDLLQLFPGNDQVSINQRMDLLREAFDKEWSMFEPSIPSSGGESGDTRRGEAPKEKSIDDIPPEYIEKGRRLGLNDKEIMASFDEDMATNGGVVS